MITLTKGQKVPENEHLVVLEGGEYEDGQLVLCAMEGETEAISQFEARYIAN